MMKKYLISSITVAFYILGLSSCSNQNDIESDINEGLENEPKTCRLIMDITRGNYDDVSTRSASSWENGDVVYLVFNSENGKVYGDAFYTNGNWQLTYYGNLSENVGATCMAVYIENSTDEIGSVISCDYNSAIYETTNAQYTFDGSTLSVVASLYPKTGRIRFNGDNGSSFKLYGISYYTSFDTSTGEYNSTTQLLPLTVTGNYTPYVYGYYTNNEAPLISVIFTGSAFAKQFPLNIYQAGQSGYVTLPSTTSHSGWRNRAIFSVNGIELTMIPVEFNEGNFLLAETETTEEFFAAVTDTESSSQKPKTGYSYWNTFITNLNQMTGITFRYPTYKEWIWAFKGGNLSQGYTYSGSDDIYAVAWFSGNSNSEKHDVKLLQPNELGFYDMSGNAAEWTSDERGWGGSYRTSAQYCSFDYDSYTSYYMDGAECGVRLAISND